MFRFAMLFNLAALFVTVSTAPAQQPRTITPGLTMDEVRAVFGAPAVVREWEDWTYFFYTNRCLPRCGTDDTVFFLEGRVVTAVLHSPGRKFAGRAAAAALAEAAPAAILPGREAVAAEPSEQASESPAPLAETAFDGPSPQPQQRVEASAIRRSRN